MLTPNSISQISSKFRANVSFLLSGLFVLPLLAAVAPAEHIYAQEVPSELRRSSLIAPAAEQSCLLVLKDQLDAATALQTAGAVDGTRIERGTAIYQALSAHASSTQATLVTLLTEREAQFNQFYIFNMIEVIGDDALCTELESHPDVDRVEDNPIVQGQLAVDLPTASFSSYRMAEWLTVSEYTAAERSQAAPYGLDVSGALDAHVQGYLGKGITVASQDTGVQWNHPWLKDKYRGWTGDDATVDHVYNWYDVWGIENRRNCDATNAQIPCDDNGHGTHTVGTILGGSPADDSLIGMAPDAEWIGCRNMLGGLGRPSSYTSCFEFFLAPFPQGGNKFTDGRPDLGPDIINNSWGCPPEEGCDASASLILDSVVTTMRAAGQFVVASAGNSGSSCGSVNQPIAMHDSSFSIGAHNAGGNIASFSSRGPVLVDSSGRPKPDISAPGVNVLSAFPMSDVTQTPDARGLSGTSMAAPHVAGASALLWSAVPPLIGDIDQTEEILRSTAAPSTAPMTNCTDGTEEGYDYAHGHGSLNIMAAIDNALARYPISITVNLTTSSVLRSGVTSVVLVDPTSDEEISQTVDSGTALLPPNGVVQFQNVIARPYLVRVENEEGVVGETQINTVAGTNTSIEINLSSTQNLFFPVLMGGS